VTLLINDRAELQVAWSGGEHDTTALVPLLIRGSSISLCSVCTIQPATFYTRSHAHTKHTLFLTPKKVIISLALSLTTRFIINVNVLSNRTNLTAYRHQRWSLGRMCFSLSCICFISVRFFCMHSYWHVMPVITPLHSKTCLSAVTSAVFKETHDPVYVRQPSTVMAFRSINRPP
jgi:hypothetical protein